jgi:hypothetical protein
MPSKKVQLSRADLEELMIGLGSQGAAALSILLKLTRALVSKGVLKPIELTAILDAAAESAGKSPDQLGGRYSKEVEKTIRQMMDEAPKKPSVPETQH